MVKEKLQTEQTAEEPSKENIQKLEEVEEKKTEEIQIGKAKKKIEKEVAGAEKEIAEDVAEIEEEVKEHKINEKKAEKEIKKEVKEVVEKVSEKVEGVKGKFGGRGFGRRERLSPEEREKRETEKRLEEWKPKTKLGEGVRKGKIKDIDKILEK